jgi:hypothetical protein
MIDLDALESLLAKATPGPWAEEGPRDEEGTMCFQDAGGGLVGLACISSDTRVIIALRSAAPALIAEVRRLERMEAVIGAVLSEQAQVEHEIGCARCLADRMMQAMRDEE